MVRIGKLVTQSLPLVALIVGSFLFIGCATSRGILEVPLNVGDNPAQGREVKIVRVSDRRTFQLKPPDPSIPSLKDGEINNLLITSRAIARKREYLWESPGRHSPARRAIGGTVSRDGPDAGAARIGVSRVTARTRRLRTGDTA
jgi:hypothetical protein